MIVTNRFIKRFDALFPGHQQLPPWELVAQLTDILPRMISILDDRWHINNGIAIHKTAMIETGAILKAPVIVGEDCFVGANACLRGGVFLDGSVKIGMGCEIKTSIIFSNSAIAHFNFIGDSIIGSHVNFEAGAVAANHYNEREDKIISILINAAIINTGVIKFGTLAGDHSKIGANAVLSPGTILPPHSIVKRLELVDQLSSANLV